MAPPNLRLRSEVPAGVIWVQWRQAIGLAASKVVRPLTRAEAGREAERRVPKKPVPRNRARSIQKIPMENFPRADFAYSSAGWKVPRRFFIRQDVCPEQRDHNVRSDSVRFKSMTGVAHAGDVGPSSNRRLRHARLLFNRAAAEPVKASPTATKATLVWPSPVGRIVRA